MHVPSLPSKSSVQVLVMGYVGKGNQCPLKRPLLAFPRVTFLDGWCPTGINVAPSPDFEKVAYFGATVEFNPHGRGSY